jgi:uncharacterized protein YjiS (DUF1127 family)
MSNLILTAARGLAGRLVEWRRRERAYAELTALDDRALADIGISRAEIPFVVAGRVASATSTLSTGLPANANHRAAA